MDLRATLAAQDYAAAKSNAAPAPGAGGNALVGAAQDFAAIMQGGEATAIEAMAGQTGPHALVQALAETEFAVEAAVTIRDKVVEAYQEILRMPV